MRRDLAICLGLFLGTLVLFGSAVSNDFVDYDDGMYVTGNPMVQRGLTVDGVRWAFTTHTAGNWHPLTWFSHMLDVQIFGMNPAGHHATSVLFHALNAVLVFLLLHRLTAAMWPSALVAALFAWHPLRVESVAWVAERKDVLSTFFGLLSMIAYGRYAKRGSRQMLVASLVAFAFSLAAKPMLVTLPCVLLLLDVWPLGRWLVPARPGATPVGLSALLIEKSAFFLLSISLSVTTVWAQKAEGAVNTLEMVAFSDRLGNALNGYLGYLRLMVWPMDLAALYPLPRHAVWGTALLSAGILAGATVFAVRSFQRRPWFAVGWFWFLGTLVPVIGLLQVGSQAMADRYSYVPCIGLGIVAAWGLAEWAACGIRARVAAAGCGGLFLMYALLTHFQIGVWENTVSLFRNAIEVTHDNDIAQNNLGVALLKRGKTEEAAEHLFEAIRIRPPYAEAHVNLGLALTDLHRFDEARDHFRMALGILPNLAQAHYYMGLSLAGEKATDEAKQHLLKAVELAPLDSGIRAGVATAFLRMHEPIEALRLAERAVARDPQSGIDWRMLGHAQLLLNEPKKAAAAWRQAIAVDPHTAQTYIHLGRLLATHAEFAPDDAQEALKLAEHGLQMYGASATPDMMDTYAATLANVGRFEEAAKIATRAAERAKTAGQDKLAESILSHSEMFRQGKPLRESAIPEL